MTDRPDSDTIRLNTKQAIALSVIASTFRSTGKLPDRADVLDSLNIARELLSLDDSTPRMKFLEGLVTELYSGICESRNDDGCWCDWTRRGKNYKRVHSPLCTALKQYLVAIRKSGILREDHDAASGV